ncbi:hypothetical protein B0H13DRAFT_2271787 [Mycena leptocephala]|nr:hypothetical protein B0H13DRAFT_2271787 [Mycena leptocephala]
MKNNSILMRKTRQKTAEKRERRAVGNTWARYRHPSTYGWDIGRDRPFPSALVMGPRYFGHLMGRSGARSLAAGCSVAYPALLQSRIREFAVATGSHWVAFLACGARWLRHYGGSCNDAFDTCSNVLYSTVDSSTRPPAGIIDSFVPFLRNDLQKGSELDSGLENGFLHGSTMGTGG